MKHNLKDRWFEKGGEELIALQEPALTKKRAVQM
jgi:hypothetical protein